LLRDRQPTLGKINTEVSLPEITPQQANERLNRNFDLSNHIKDQVLIRFCLKQHERAERPLIKETPSMSRPTQKLNKAASDGSGPTKLAVIYRPIEALKPDSANLRRHSKKQI
jgi:hypothetical protein